MPKVSKLEALRQGKVIEDSPGVYARLNPENKSIEYSTGEISHIGDDPDYFPRNELDRKTSLEKEKIEKDIDSFGLGKKAGEFAYQFGQKGMLSGGAGDWVDRATNTGDDYLAKRSAKQQVSSRISDESPIMSGAATLTSFAPDMLATGGMSAAKAAPILTTASAGSRVIDEPMDVAGEALVSSGAGFILDKGIQFLNPTAGRRGASRAVAREAEEVQARNLAGATEAEAENLAQREAFQKEQRFADRENQARRHQANLESASREKQMLESQKAYEEAKALNSAESEALKNEYREAQRSYQESLESIPAQQRSAQKEISDRAVKYYDKVSSQIPENGSINVGALGAEEFVETNITKGALTNTKEGKEASKIINSIFGGSEEIGGQELSRRLRVLDEVIERSPRETQVILDQFKRSMSRNLANEIASEISYREILPAFSQSLKNDVKMAFEGFKPMEGLGIGRNKLIQMTQESVENTINSMPRQEFLSKVRSGEIVEDILQKSLPKDRFVSLGVEEKSLGKLRKQGMDKYLSKSNPVETATKNYEILGKRLAENIENSLASAELNATKSASQARRVTNRNFREAYGLAEPITPPSPPVEPSYPQAPQKPQPLPSVQPSIPVESSQMPIQRGFTPEATPTLSASQGVAEGFGDFLERPMGELMKGKYDLGLLGNLTKLKYLAGAKSLPMAGVYGMAKGLTSPTAGGAMARQGMQMGGLDLIVSNISSRVPSYKEGVIQDHMERKMVVAQIEQNPRIGIEDKAMLQTYINRGKNLETLTEVQNG